MDKVSVAWRIIRLVMLRTLMHWLELGMGESLGADRIFTYGHGDQILREPFAGWPIMCRRCAASDSSTRPAPEEAGNTAEIKLRLVLPRGLPFNIAPTIHRAIGDCRSEPGSQGPPWLPRY